MKKAIRNALLGLVGTSIGLYVMAVPPVATAYASTSYNYFNYNAANVNNTSSTSQDPVAVVKAASQSLGFDAANDKFTLVSQSNSLAVINVIHKNTSYDVNLQARRNGSWSITSVKPVKNGKAANTTANNSGSVTNNGSLPVGTGTGSTASNTAGSTTASSGNGLASTVTGTSSANAAAAEQQAISLLNADRRANGLSDLQVDSRITAVAEKYAQDMVNRNYFSHYSPEGQSPFDRLTQAGISYSTAGENIGMNQSVQQAEVAFMNSSGHRANILNTNYTKVGIGVAYDKNGNVYVVQDFIKP